MVSKIVPTPDPTCSAERLNEALRALATTYIGARRAGGELRTRLLALEHERAQLLRAIGDREYGSATDRELAEIDRVRRMIARSSAASSERLRALEAVIAAIAGNALVQGAARASTTPSPQFAPSQAPSSAEARPNAVVRGGWSPPSDAVVGSDGPVSGRRLR